MTDYFDNIREDIVSIVKDQQKYSFDNIRFIEQETSARIAQSGNIIQDTERNTLQTLDNTQENIGHSTRFVAKNIVGLIDNMQDNVYRITNDTQTNITNTFQMFAILTGVGIVVFAILYGENMMKRGMKVGQLSLF